jgi:signal transduction histidine kinase/DNA-binding response OmpR family regulator
MNTKPSIHELSTKPKILLIDDKLDDLKATKLFLEKHFPNFIVEVTDKTTKALELVSEQFYPIIFCDYKMPKINGLEFLEKVREKGIKSTFIIFTGHGGEKVAIRALNLGADYYLQKGKNFQKQFLELKKVIQNLYRSRELKVVKKESEKPKKEKFLQNRKELEALLEGSRAVLEIEDFEKAARRIFDVCKDLIGAKTGYVALLTEDGSENELLFLESGGLPCSVDPELPMPIRGLREVAYRTGKAVYENNFHKSKWEKYLPEGHVEMPNVLFAPLTIRNETVGLIGLAHKDNGFTEKDSKIAKLFGEFAALALHNSQILMELKRHSNELDLKNQLLEEKKETLENFASTVAHDLRGKLGVLQLLADLVESDESERITNQIQKITSFIDDLLLITKKGPSINREMMGIDLNVLINEVVSENVPRLKSLEINVEKLPIIFGNKIRMKQVFENILNNVIDHANASKINIFSKDFDKNYTRIIIRDNGQGIPEEKMEEIMESFAARSFTSFGLRIIDKIISDHNGHLLIESSINKGTSVNIDLPSSTK